MASHRIPLGTAGLPEQMTFSRTSDTTIEPAQTTASFATVTPGQTIEPAPIQTPVPIEIGKLRYPKLGSRKL